MKYIIVVKRDGYETPDSVKFGRNCKMVSPMHSLVRGWNERLFGKKEDYDKTEKEIEEDKFIRRVKSACAEGSNRGSST